MKYKIFTVCGEQIGSPPSRGAWIEMRLMMFREIHTKVAPLAGGVD